VAVAGNGWRVIGNGFFPIIQKLYFLCNHSKSFNPENVYNNSIINNSETVVLITRNFTRKIHGSLVNNLGHSLDGQANVQPPKMKLCMNYLAI